MRSGNDITSPCSVVLPAFFNRLSANYNASTAQVFGELGYQIDAGQFGVEPFANLAYVNLHSDGFVERGGIDQPRWRHRHRHPPSSACR